MRVLRLVLKGLCLLLPLALLLVSVNYKIDGGGILRGNKYELEIATSWLEGNAVGNFGNDVNERSVIGLYADNLSQPLNCLVLGSSRAMQLTREISGVRGSFFNAGMTGADRKDILATFYQFVKADKLPSNLIIVADPWLLFDSDDALNFRDNNDLYCEFLDKCLGYTVEYTGEDPTIKAKALSSPSYFQENILYAFSDHSADSHPIILPSVLMDYPYDIRMADGTQWYSSTYRQQTQDEVDFQALNLTAVDYAQLYGFTAVSLSMAQQFEDFIQYAQSCGVTVTLVMTPFHPIYWDMLSTSENYSGVAEAEVAFRDIAMRNDIAVFGSYDPAVAGCANTDFYDGLHVRRESIRNYFPGILYQSLALHPNRAPAGAETM